jgi:DNA-binding NtrC family response regulator
MGSVLVVDDEVKMLTILKLNLQEDSHEVYTATSGEDAISILEKHTIGAVVTDMRMPGMSGADLLLWIKGNQPYVQVIMLTAYESTKDAVAAMREGALDYLTKPCDMDELRVSVNKALDMRQDKLELQYYREKEGLGDLIGQSEPMQRVFEMIKRVADSSSTVLILGESGTGKELVARAIHDNSSRRSGPMISLNCMAVPDDLLESELFGHVRGAFTGAIGTRIGKMDMAHRGTLFLDEIGDMKLPMQGKLLRALQEKVIEPVGGSESRRVDVRIIAATNVDLKARVKEGIFREDLYYRLNVVPITLPPLRNRRDDIPLLLRHFLETRYHANEEVVKSLLDEDKLRALSHYRWPGNVRELENIIERAVVLGTTDLAGLMGVPPAPSSAKTTESSAKEMDFDEHSYRDAKQSVLESFERRFFTRLLKKSRGNVSRAAEMCRMHRKNLHTKLVELQINPREYS